MRGTPRRLTSIVAVSLAAAALVSGCAGGGTAQPPTSTAPAAAPAGFPVTVQNCGRTLTFDRPPTRVITGYQNTIEMMLALGLQDNIIARQGWPQGMLLPEQVAAYNAIKEISSGKSGDQTSTKEVTLSLQPDFFFATTADSNTDGARGLATEADLKANGAQVFYMMCTAHTGSNSIDSNDPRSNIDIVYSRIEDLGKIFAVPDRAAALVAKMKSQIATAQERIKGLPMPRVFVYAGDYNGPTGPIPGQSDQHFDLSLAGGKNVLGKDQPGYPDLSKEAIANFNPEVILTYLTTRDKGPFDQESRKKMMDATARAYDEFIRTTFPNVSAVQNNRIVSVPGLGFAPGVRNSLVVRQIAEALHPEAFQDHFCRSISGARICDGSP